MQQPPHPTRLMLALAGVLTGLAGIATSQAAAWALRTRTSPLQAVAEFVRDLAPGNLAPTLIHIVGHWDKPLLVAGTALGMLALCAFAGTLTRRHPLWADLVFFGLAVIGLVAVLHQSSPGLADGLTVVIGLVTWVAVLRLLTGPVLAESPTNPSRRAFLTRAGALAVGGAVVLTAGRVAARGRRAVEQARRLLRLPVTRGVVPAGADLHTPGTPRWRTPNARFYRIDTTLAPPSIQPSEWQLRVHGKVDNEVKLGYDDLVSRKLTEAWVTLCCVSNDVGGPLISNAYWSGVPIRDVLQDAGVHADADCVLQRSYDGWTCATPLSALTDGRNALLAVAMNGQPLPVEHGFPVRMVVPGLYGYVSATKWVVDLEVTNFDKVTAYWTAKGWGEKGPVKTESRIDVPRAGAQVKPGTVHVGGVAWSQHKGIEKVQVQLDGGPWQAAQLGKVPDDDTWVQWLTSFDVGKGDHSLRVRATDKTGYQQTAVKRGVLPDGATGWHTVRFHAG